MLSPFKRRSCRITREIKDLCARFQLSTCSWSMIRSLFAVTSSSIALLFVPLPHPPLFVVVLPLLLPHPSRPRPSSSFSSSSFPLSSSSSFSSSPSSSSSFLLFSSLPSSSSSVCARGAPGLGSAQVPTALPWRTRSPPEHPSRCPQGAGAGRAARCRSRSPGPRSAARGRTASGRRWKLPWRKIAGGTTGRCRRWRRDRSAQRTRSTGPRRSGDERWSCCERRWPSLASREPPRLCPPPPRCPRPWSDPRRCVFVLQFMPIQTTPPSSVRRCVGVSADFGRRGWM
ncbi:unnamed protein product [Prorocentrum cordatum]|uniref:Uncharacterized protein n=1 Tax=Prorocentrum cordatum TaxID=2364126 RepID=A0ABN9XER6_9DINO|nr:unnamed protein product [Polarella glacialis]